MFAVRSCILGQYVQHHRWSRAGARESTRRYRPGAIPWTSVMRRRARPAATPTIRSPTLSLPGQRGWSARHQFANRRVFIALLQHRADADQRQLHRYVEILRRARPQIIGVRVGGKCVGIQENLEDVLALELYGARQPNTVVKAYSSVATMLFSSLPANLRRNQSFFTRLRHKSRASSSDFGQGALSRMYW